VFVELSRIEETRPDTTAVQMERSDCAHTQYLGEVLVKRCDSLLIELYEFGKTKDKHFSELFQKFGSSEIPGLREKLQVLEDELPSLKRRLRKRFIEKEITQKIYQAELKAARGLIDKASKKLDSATDAFFAGISRI
jgi:hypothetical protein